MTRANVGCHRLLRPDPRVWARFLLAMCVLPPLITPQWGFAQDDLNADVVLEVEIDDDVLEFDDDVLEIDDDGVIRDVLEDQVADQAPFQQVEAAVEFEAVEIEPAIGVEAPLALPAVPMMQLRPAARVGGPVGQVFLQALNAAASEVSVDETPPWGSTTAPPLLAKQSADWKYWDRTEAPAANWFAPDCDDSSWRANQAPLGYGKSFIKSTISQDLQPRERPLASYFRRHFEWHPGETRCDSLGLLLMYDDAAAVYINGVEVHRENLAAGKLDHATRSRTAITGTQEGKYVAVLIDATSLRDGDNLIAVSVHQTNSTSNDLAFDLELHEVSRQMSLQVAINHPAGGPEVRNRAARLAEYRNTKPVRLRDRHRQNRRDNTDRSNDVTLRSLRQVIPRARFQWAYEGDSLASIGLLAGVDVQQLALLNSVSADHVFARPSLVCTEWLHKVRLCESWSSIAELYGVDVTILEQLNPTSFGTWLSVDQIIRVPGKFTCEMDASNSAVVQATMYCAERTPRFGISNGQGRVAVGEDLPRFAARHRADAQQIARLNNIPIDWPLPAGLLLKTPPTCVVPEAMTVGDVALVFGVDADQICYLNQIENEREMLEAGRQIVLPQATVDASPEQQIRDAQMGIVVRRIGRVVAGGPVVGWQGRMDAAADDESGAGPKLVEWTLGSSELKPINSVEVP